jgi:hypothetical protein
MYPSSFNDFQGSRGEFLKCLAEQGEDPAFIRRAQSVDEAWTQLVEQCKSHREVLLRWPWMHLSILADRLKHDWSQLAQYLADESQVSYFENLHKDWKLSLENRTISANAWLSIRRILGDFVSSVDRFNESWRKFLQGVNLDELNRLRRDYNQHYPVEKACAFDCEDIERLGFTPLDPVTFEQLSAAFPPLAIPKLRNH